MVTSSPTCPNSTTSSSPSPTPTPPTSWTPSGSKTPTPQARGRFPQALSVLSLPSFPVLHPHTLPGQFGLFVVKSASRHISTVFPSAVRTILGSTQQRSTASSTACRAALSFALHHLIVAPPPMKTPKPRQRPRRLVAMDTADCGPSARKQPFLALSTEAARHLRGIRAIESSIIPSARARKTGSLSRDAPSRAR